MKYIDNETLIKASKVREDDDGNSSSSHIFPEPGSGISLFKFANIKGTDLLYNLKYSTSEGK